MFFYNLGGYSLVDFDEAWWAEVATNILERRNPLVLYFNGQPSFFHPPFGYSLIAISQGIFGVNEFASRLPSAVLGFGSVLLIYLIGKQLFSKFVGLTSALMLASSAWFVFRSRSANLDSILVFFFLLTLLLFITSNGRKRFIYLSAVSFSLLFLTKTFIGVSVLIPIFVYFLLNRKDYKFKIRHYCYTFLFSVSVLTPWLVANYLEFANFRFLERLFSNALKAHNRIPPDITGIYNSTPVAYLHFGIREWFYPAIIGFFGSFLFVKKYPNILAIYAWIIPLMFAFLTNRETAIWHILPLYPAFGILIGVFLDGSLESFKKILNYLNRKKIGDIILKYVTFSILILLTVLSGKQIIEFKDDIGMFGSHQTDIAAVSKSAANFPDSLYLDNDHLLPSTVFYSKKNVKVIRELPGTLKTAEGFIISGPKPSLLITEKWRLKKDNMEEFTYEVLTESGEYLLIRPL